MKTLPLGLLALWLSAPFAVAQTTGNAAPESQANVENSPVVLGAEIGSQAYPAKYSTHNDTIDNLPIMALPVPLTDDQKRRIVQAVLGQNAPIETISVAPSEKLPDRVEPVDLPAGLAAEIPMLTNFTYVRIPDRVLLVRAANKIVVGEIAVK